VHSCIAKLSIATWQPIKISLCLPYLHVDAMAYDDERGCVIHSDAYLNVVGLFFSTLKWAIHAGP
jgi:hypothetical protein